MPATSAVPETDLHSTGHADTTHRMSRNPVTSYPTSSYPKVTSFLTVTSRQVYLGILFDSQSGKVNVDNINNNNVLLLVIHVHG